MFTGYVNGQLDAMKQAGLRLTDFVSEDILALTLKVDNVRGGTAEDINAVLQAKGLTGEQFTAQVRAASDRLAAAGVKERQFADLAKFLTPQCDDLARLKGLAQIK